MPEVDADAVETLDEQTLLGQDVEDLDFDDIEDPPGFLNNLPDGVYDLLVTKGSIEEYKVKNPEAGEPPKKKRFAIYYEIVGVIELTDTAEQEPKVGDKFGERFLMNEDGMKYWKGKAKAILGDMGKVKVSNVLSELSTGKYYVRARASNKETKGTKAHDKDKVYTNTNIRIVARANDIPGLEAAVQEAAQGQGLSGGAVVD